MKYIAKITSILVLVMLMAGNMQVKADVTINPVEKKTLYLPLSDSTDTEANTSDADTTDTDVNVPKAKDTVRYAKLLGITRKQAKKLGVIALSSDPSIVVCDDETRTVRAVGMGTAAVTLSCSGTDTDVKIVVKKNAKSVRFGRDFAGNLSERTFETGTAYELSLPRSKGGVKQDTDSRRLIVTNSKGKDVTEKVAKSTGVRLWTIEFTSAGEYTITGEAFQSSKKPETTASAQIKVSVVAPKPGFGAKQTGVSTIKVTGEGFTSDTKFTVTKGTNEIAVDKAEPAKNGESAVVTLKERIGNGTYTVSDGTDTDTFEGETEYAAKIVITGNGEQVFTNGDGTRFYAYYDILNQFEESARIRFSAVWTPSYGSLVRDDRKRGVLEFAGSSSDVLTFGYPVSLTGVISNTGVSEHAVFTVGLPRFADKAEVMGIVNLQTKKTVKKVPANFKYGEYGIYFKLLDASGAEIAYNKATADELTVTSQDPLTAGIDYNGDSILVDDVDYAYAVIVPGYYAKSGGKAEIGFISTKTGGDSSYTLKLSAGQVLDVFRFLSYDGIITELKSDATDSDAYTLPFEAFDTEGEPITAFKDLVGAVKLSGGGLKLIEANDGTAKLKYTPKNLQAAQNAPIMVNLTAIVPESGNADTVMTEVLERRKPAAVKGLVKENPLYVFCGESYRIYERKNSDYSYLDYYDQYGDGFTWKTSDAFGSHVECVSFDSSVISSLNSHVTGSDGTYFAINIRDDATAISDTAEVEFALFDGNSVEIPGSRKKVTLGIVDINSFGSFTLSCNKSYSLKNKEDSASFSVSGILSDGTKVSVPNAYVEYIKPEETVNGISYSAITHSGSSWSWSPNYNDPAAGNFSSFLDYSTMQSDGQHPARFYETQIQARIYCLSGGAIYTEGLRGTASLVKKIGNSDRKTVKLNTETSDNTRLKWISASKKKAYVIADNGVIDTATLMKAMESRTKRGTDNYGKSRTIEDGDIVIEISDYKENTDALYTDYNSSTGSYKIVNGSSGPSIINAEIGDTFTATYKYSAEPGNELSVAVSFTVGADKNAFIDENGVVPAWY